MTARKRQYPRKVREKIKWGKYAVLVLVLFLFYLFGNVWQSVFITRLTQRNARLSSELRKIQAENSLLHVEIEQLKEPARIRTILEKKMSLTDAKTINVFIENEKE